MRRSHALPYASLDRPHRPNRLTTLGWSQFAILAVVIAAVILLGLAVWAN
ncbi:MAG TPA: hypothetical protein VK886_15675 [Vicinamibacterales bacterium]|nr:hypothetical protein [Vicinamibacterales bacterium]